VSTRLSNFPYLRWNKTLRGWASPRGAHGHGPDEDPRSYRSRLGRVGLPSADANLAVPAGSAAPFGLLSLGRRGPRHMRVTGSGTARDVYWNFARAEFEVPAGGPRHAAPPISAQLRRRIERGDRDHLSPHDWRELRAAVLSVRGAIVRPLLVRVKKWYLAELSPDDIRELRVMNLHIFTSIVPSRGLIDFAASLDRGAFPTIWDPRFYRALHARFDPRKMHGIPIVVGARDSGPFTLIEGTTRMSVVASRLRLGEPVGDSLPVVLGLGPAVAGWEWY
jgi:hypothetical protein